MYSFSLAPEDFFNPSGSCNLSVIEHTLLELDGDTNINNRIPFNAWVTNWNILEIHDGMGCVKFYN